MNSKKEESEEVEDATTTPKTAKDDAVVGPPVLAEEDRPDYEVRKHKTARRPLLPTKAEIDDHYPLHLTYRSWCKHCVAGKARSNQHVQSNEEQIRLGVTLNADYAFMSGEHNEGEHGWRHSSVDGGARDIDIARRFRRRGDQG